MGKLDVSRRGFLKASVMAGVSVTIAPIGSRAFAALFEENNPDARAMRTPRPVSRSFASTASPR